MTTNTMGMVGDAIAAELRTMGFYVPAGEKRDALARAAIGAIREHINGMTVETALTPGVPDGVAACLRQIGTALSETGE